MSDFYEEVGLSRVDLLARLQAVVKPSRYKHSLGVEKAAEKLAQRNGGDVHRARLAGLLHDYAKELPNSEFLRLIDTYELDPELKGWGNNVWHGKVGIYKIREDLSLQDAEILHAIEIHTVGAAQMSLLDKIVYVADYIEAGRDFDGVETARKIAKRSLDEAVAYESAQTVEYLAAKRVRIYPQTLETYNAFVGELRCKTS